MGLCAYFEHAKIIRWHHCNADNFKIRKIIESLQYPYVRTGWLVVSAKFRFEISSSCWEKCKNPSGLLFATPCMQNENEIFRFLCAPLYRVFVIEYVVFDSKTPHCIKCGLFVTCFTISVISTAAVVLLHFDIRVLHIDMILSKMPYIIYNKKYNSCCYVQ